jgi:hypothetical protein
MQAITDNELKTVILTGISSAIRCSEDPAYIAEKVNGYLWAGCRSQPRTETTAAQVERVMESISWEEARRKMLTPRP